jgi:hypothetical protein
MVVYPVLPGIFAFDRGTFFRGHFWLFGRPATALFPANLLIGNAMVEISNNAAAPNPASHEVREGTEVEGGILAAKPCGDLADVRAGVEQDRHTHVAEGVEADPTEIRPSRRRNDPSLTAPIAYPGIGGRGEHPTVRSQRCRWARTHQRRPNAGLIFATCAAHAIAGGMLGSCSSRSVACRLPIMWCSYPRPRARRSDGEALG